MSDIDGNIHYHVGYFMNLPLYLPYKDKYMHEDGTEYEPATLLCIGGGSGEHPALVIDDFQCCVVKFINLVYEKHFNKMFYDYPDDCPAKSILEDDVYWRYTPFDMNQWSFENWHVRYHNVADLHSIDRFNKFLRTAGSFESMITVQIGQWLFKHAPHLIDKSFDYFADKKIVTDFKFEIEFFEMVPPERCAGMRIENNTAIWNNPYPYDLYSRK